MKRWYLECFCLGATLGTEFPTRAYYDEDPQALAKAAAELLARTLESEVDEVRIARTTERTDAIPLAELYRGGGVPGDE